MFTGKLHQTSNTALHSLRLGAGLFFFVCTFETVAQVPSPVIAALRTVTRSYPDAQRASTARDSKQQSCAPPRLTRIQRSRLLPDNAGLCVTIFVLETALGKRCTAASSKVSDKDSYRGDKLI